MAETNGAGPQINLIHLIKRTVERVIASTGLQETEATVRMVASCFVNLAAEYVRAVGDDPEHIEKLFHAFLTGTEDEQREAVKAYGEAFLKEKNEDAAVAHVTPHVEVFPEANKTPGERAALKVEPLPAEAVVKENEHLVIKS